jgi:hypothetical protein
MISFAGLIPCPVIKESEEASGDFNTDGPQSAAAWGTQWQNVT